MPTELIQDVFKSNYDLPLAVACYKDGKCSKMFQRNSNNMSRLSMIVRVNVVLSRTVIDSDCLVVRVRQ